MPKIREMMKSLKVDQVTEEVSRALEHMNKEIANISPEAKEVAQKKDWHNNPWIKIPKKTPAERRERHHRADREPEQAILAEGVRIEAAHQHDRQQELQTLVERLDDTQRQRSPRKPLGGDGFGCCAHSCVGSSSAAPLTRGV